MVSASGFVLFEGYRSAPVADSLVSTMRVTLVSRAMKEVELFFLRKARISRRCDKMSKVVSITTPSLAELLTSVYSGLVYSDTAGDASLRLVMKPRTRLRVLCVILFPLRSSSSMWRNMAASLVSLLGMISKCPWRAFTINPSEITAELGRTVLLSFSTQPKSVIMLCVMKNASGVRSCSAAFSQSSK